MGIQNLVTPAAGRDLQAGAPAAVPENPFGTDAAGIESVRKLAFLDQSKNLALVGKSCLTQAQLGAINNKNERENHPENCAKLNAAGMGTPYFDAGPMQVNKKGRFAFFSSRN